MSSKNLRPNIVDFPGKKRRKTVFFLIFAFQLMILCRNDSLLLRERDRLLKRDRCTGLPVYWKLYRVSRQVVKTRLRKAEQEYIIKEMDGCRSPSSQWKLIRSCLPRKETTQHVYTREVKEIVEEFNDFFCVCWRQCIRSI